MKLKTLLIILIVFFILRAINSPYAKTPTTAQLVATATTLRKAATAATAKAVKAETAAAAAVGTSTAAAKANTAKNLRKAATAATTKAVKAEMAATAAGGVIPKGFAGTAGTTKWLLLSSFRQFIAKYDKTVTPPNWTSLGYIYTPGFIGRPSIIRNMIISQDSVGTVEVYNPDLNVFTVVPTPNVNNVYANYQDIWYCAMGDTLIGARGHVTTYTPGPNGTYGNWSQVEQGPPDNTITARATINYWYITMNNNMVITQHGDYSVLSSSGWSSVQHGPTLSGLDLWSISMENRLISRFGMVSEYIASTNSWTTPVQLLPKMNFIENPVDRPDWWNVILDDMVISSGGEIYKYSNGLFSKIQTPSFPDIVANSQFTLWNGAMKLN